MNNMSELQSYEVETLVQGYQGNIRDSYTVAVLEDGNLWWQVTCTRHCSVNLPQDGLEIPCRLIFSCRFMV